MRITISRNVLADALAELNPLAGKNKALMILDNIKFVTKGNKIRLQTSDAETTIRKYVEAYEIDQDGSFLVDCASLAAFIGRVKDDKIILTIEDGTLTAKHSKGKASFQTLPSDDFPEVNQDEAECAIEMNAADFSRLVSVARNFVSHDDFRPMFKPIRAIIENGTFTVCATDTRTLFKDSVRVADDTPATSWYIEQSAFAMLVNACKSNDKITIVVAPKSVTYRVGATTYFTRQTAANFPNIDRVIPKSHKIEVKCDKKDTMDSLFRSALFVDESSLVKISVTGAEMEIKADNVNRLTQMSEKISCESTADITFGVNVNMLSQCAKACSTPELLFEFNDPSAAFMLKDVENPERVILCMPMSILP